LIERLLAALRTLPVGQAPEIKRIIEGKVAILSRAAVDPGASRLENLEIPAHPELPNKTTPEIFVSYAWGDDSSEDARQRGEIVERMCETLGRDGWKVVRDKTAMRYGDLISDFMKLIGQADHVIVVLNDKYFRSPYCMTELHAIYRRSNQEKEDFLRRIIPLVLADARFVTPGKRIEYAKYWETEYLNLKADLDYLSVEDFRLYQNMKRWYVDAGNMLSHISDVLTPHGFDEIVKNDFAALRQMLKRRSHSRRLSAGPTSSTLRCCAQG